MYIFGDLSEIDVKKKRAKNGSLRSALMCSARLSQIAVPNKLDIAFTEQIFNEFTHFSWETKCPKIVNQYARNHVIECSCYIQKDN